jgi:hypothetical protein
MLENRAPSDGPVDLVHDPHQDRHGNEADDHPGWPLGGIAFEVIFTAVVYLPHLSIILLCLDRGGRRMTLGSARSRPRASAGSVSVPRSMARIRNTVSGSGTRLPDRANR